MTDKNTFPTLINLNYNAQTLINANLAIFC